MMNEFTSQAFDDKNEAIDDEYMFGDSLLVVPALTPHQGSINGILRKVVFPV